MKCNCSSINKHEIVGLCDIEKFNDKIKEFKDKSWTQVVISDNVVLLGARPSIKIITKTFVDVKITSTKLINTPKSKDPSVEGLKLTGKLLLIAGEIKQRILYISNCGNSDRIHSFKIKSPFTTHIVVDENVDIAQDKFCIYPCIEYSSVRPISQCSLNQNVTLFLFAHKTNNPNPNPPEPSEPYPNEIIFKKLNGDELAKVVFDITDNTLTVTKTGNVESGSREVLVEFKVFNSDGTTRREIGQILGTENATGFVTALNGKKFNYGDIVSITYYQKPQRVQITNYPNDGHDYQPTFLFNEYFIVTDRGLVPYIPNKIIANNSANKQVVEVSFSSIDKKLKVISTGEKFDDVIGEWYLRVRLVSSTGGFKQQGEIRSNEDGTAFKNSLDDVEYSIGDFVYIKTEIKNREHTKITNFPVGGATHTLGELFERFEIKANGLVAKLPNQYPNEIALKTNTGQQFCKLTFSFSSKKIVFNSFDSNVTEAGSSTMIIEVKLYASDGTTLKKSGRINKGENIINFFNDIDTTDFEYGDIIEINSTDNQNRIQISNFPTDRRNYTPSTAVERFRINFDRFTKVNP